MCIEIPNYEAARKKAEELGYDFVSGHEDGFYYVKTPIWERDKPYCHADIFCWTSNPKVVESAGVYVSPIGQGHGTKFMQDRLAILKAGGVTTMVASVRKDNAAQIALMKKFNWSCLCGIDDTTSLWGTNI